MEIIVNIITGVISGIIVAFLLEILRSNSTWFPGPSEAPRYVEREYLVNYDSLDDMRSKNSGVFQASCHHKLN